MHIENYLSKKIGIIGGGQLGKMMVIEASKMGIQTIILDPSNDCPASSLANGQIIANFDDKKSLMELAKIVDVLTYEFEHISVDALKDLEKEGIVVHPNANILEIIQNKYNQKIELKKKNIPLGEFQKINNYNDIKAVAEEYGYPIMLKSALGGYDGKGNSIITNEEDIQKSFMELNGEKNTLYAEKYIAFKKEISVLSCRGGNGDIKIYPVAENIHKDSILFETSVPATITLEEEEKAMRIAKDVCEVFGGVGMLCVEMFLTEHGDILVNEVAPRPHNSGHYTINACTTSQFENHIRAIIGLPLGETDLLVPVVMRNILGEAGYEGTPCILGAYEALSVEGISLHIYGKTKTKSNRKMGHLIATASSLENAKLNAEKASKLVKIVSI